METIETTTGNEIINEENPKLKEKQFIADLDLKKLQIAERRIYLKNCTKRKLTNSEDKINMEKIKLLGNLLSTTIAEDNLFSFESNAKRKPIFSEDECWIIKDKLFRIIEKL